jgi:hypothetical protein
MLSPNYIIDTVQNNKKLMVNTFVTNAGIKKSLLELIDAQTAYTKSVANNCLLFGQIFVSNISPRATK